MVEATLDGLSRDELLRLMPLVDEAERRIVLESLEAYSRWLYPEEPPMEHHRLFIAAFERACAGGREIVMAPPGSAKSSYCTVRGPSWYVGKHANKRIICGSHTDDLASDFGRKVRNICSQQEYDQAFGTRVSGDNRAMQGWSLTNNTQYTAVGVGKGIAGKRADLLIIDDPYPSYAVAMSDTYNNEVLNWYQNDLWPRLKPNAGILVIQTRWRYDDLSGYLINHDAEKWNTTILRFESEGDDPLGRERGALLWPEYFTPEMLRVAKTRLTYPALFQQRPLRNEGDFFKREWIKWYKPEERPENLTIYASSDYAVTKDGGDATCLLIWGVDENFDMYLLDCWHGHDTSYEWTQHMFSLYRQWKPIEWLEEKGQIEKGVGPFIEQAQARQNVRFYRNALPSTTNKRMRAESFRGYMASGQVYFPHNKTWAHELVTELLEFPKDGVPDDRVDACTLMGTRLAMLRRPVKPKSAEPTRWLQNLSINEIIRRKTRARMEKEW